MSQIPLPCMLVMHFHGRQSYNLSMRCISVAFALGLGVAPNPQLQVAPEAPLDMAEEAALAPSQVPTKCRQYKLKKYR